MTDDPTHRSRRPSSGTKPRRTPRRAGFVTTTGIDQAVSAARRASPSTPAATPATPVALPAGQLRLILLFGAEEWEIARGQLQNINIQQVNNDLDVTAFGETERFVLPRRSVHVTIELEVRSEPR